ncbi:MAG: hypothetical protein ACRDAG_11500 [Cetobacterium somerae]|uniref:Uncharacterized protein n=1 Tax=Cetobacterium somerae ATCC BAA-474 TaxID=1319815 RepID=U7VE99_9FUSO|nr:hypothetical protein [Cetobacterium somerae]ERT69464.1 hypothetical protein HMPREF0202_00615 [Cetobacterium somerae ATCC BAA-474]MCQ9625463.1 hypothetical protein [Cetobacterium somerae]
MKSRIFFKIFTFVIVLVIGYFLYEHIIILRNEYIKREQHKNMFLEKIDGTYKERSNDFYKNN